MTFTKLFEQELAQRAYPDAEVSYSLNSCQGDGLSFTGQFDLPLILEKLFARGCRSLSLLYFQRQDLNGCKLNVTRGNLHYFHERSTSLDFCDNFYYLCQEAQTPPFVISQLDEIIQADYIEECVRLANRGYEAISASYFDDEMVYEFDGPLLLIQIKVKDSEGYDITDFLSGDSEYDDEDIDSYFRGEIAVNLFDLTIHVAGSEVHSETRIDCYPSGKARAHAFSFLKEVLQGVRSEIKESLKVQKEAFA